MHVVVTGVNGFVGKHLTDELLANGHSVSGIILPGTPALDNIPCVSLDICDAAELARCIQTLNPDACIHLAGIAFVPIAQSNPGLVFDVNFGGVVNLLESFRHIQSKAKILVVTSAEVYGRRHFEHGVTEETPIYPSSLYGISKSSADMVTREYHKSFGLHTMTARADNHMGPGQSIEFVSSAFATRISDIAKGKTEPVIEVGNLESHRDFTDVRDVVRAYRLLIEKGHPGEAYNIASGTLRPIQEILDGLMDVAGVQAEIKVNQEYYRPTDTSPHFITTKLNEHTGWKAEIPIEKTLQDVYSYFHDS